MTNSHSVPMACGGFCTWRAKRISRPMRRCGSGTGFIPVFDKGNFRCMREKGCAPLTEAQVALDGYPDTSKTWKEVQSARSGREAWAESLVEAEDLVE